MKLTDGEALWVCRKLLGLTQAALAERFGCPERTVSFWETGARPLGGVGEAWLNGSSYVSKVRGGWRLKKGRWYGAACYRIDRKRAGARQEGWGGVSRRTVSKREALL